MNEKFFSAETLPIFDWDGTQTKIEPESLVDANDSFAANIAALCKMDKTTVSHAYHATSRHILLDLNDSYGFNAPTGELACGVADHLILMSATGRALYEELGKSLYSKEQWYGHVQEAFYSSYPRLRSTIKAGTFKLMDKLRKHPQLPWTVTNSKTNHVQSILELPVNNGLAWMSPRVRGLARKFVIGTAPPANFNLPPTITIPGMHRPTFTWRPDYFAVIDTLRQEAGRSWEEVRIVGDIVELDFFPFILLGARVALVAGPFTRQAEIDFVLSFPGCRVVQSLEELI